MIDFKKAIENAPDAFHQTVAGTLSDLAPKRAFPRRRLAVLVAAMVLLLTGVAAALISQTRLTDFLHIEPDQMKLPITSQFTLEGGMEKVDVAVREAVYDGAFLRMTVSFSLKEAANNALVYVSDNNDDMWEDAFERAPLYGHDEQVLQNAENIYFLKFASIGYYNENGKLDAQRNTFPIREYRYESPTKVVVLIDMDMRGEDGKQPNPLQIHMDSRLYLYDKARYDSLYQLGYYEVPPDQLPKDDIDSHIMFDRKDKGVMKITVDALEQETIRYQINGLPENLLGSPIISATLTETPLAYCLDMVVEQDADGYITFLMDAIDERGERIPFFSYIGSSDSEILVTKYQIVCMKQGHHAIASIRLPCAMEGDESTVYPITLAPLEETE